MSERLTDRDIARLDVPGIGDDVRMMAREIRERRAEDHLRSQRLTAEEVEALWTLREHLRMALERTEAIHREWKERALQGLDKLIAAAGGE